MVIYLDNNATTKVDERVLDAMLPFLKEEYANPSSMYEFSVKSSNAIADARVKMKEFLGAKSEKEIIFTSCGSESANTAIKGAIACNKSKKHLITTKVEHPCVLNTYKALEKQGYKVDYIGVNANGELDLEELKEKINDDTALVSTMWANNETGVIFPIQKIGEIIKSKNPHTLFFVDAVQGAGKVDIDVQSTNIDMLGVSGHKFHAPKGIGALYVKSNVMLPPLINGGHQERGHRAGTENVPALVGMGKAAQLANEILTEKSNTMSQLRDYMIHRIEQEIPYCHLNGSRRKRLPNNINISFSFVDGETIVILLDMEGVCASAGSACNAGQSVTSHVIEAIGLTGSLARGTVRFTLSSHTTKEEIDRTVDALKEIIEKNRNLNTKYHIFLENNRH